MTANKHVPTPPRPKRSDPEVHAAAVDGMWPPVREWIEGRDRGGPIDDDEAEQSKECLRSALEWEECGYKIAVVLERDGWDPDAELVEILSRWAAVLSDAHHDAVAEWVKANGIKCQFQVGAMVNVSRLGVGEVVRVNDDDATITVFYKSRGHVREGSGTRGHLVAYEDAVAAPASTDASHEDPSAS